MKKEGDAHVSGKCKDIFPYKCWGCRMVKLTCCGDDCNLCPRFVASQKGDPAKLKEIAELWYRCGWTETIVSPEEMACRGCYPEKWCRYGINTCNAEKGIKNCGECNDYPCEKIEAAFEKTQASSEKCKQVCTTKEYDLLDKAFFSKRKRLDEVNKQQKQAQK